MTTAGPDEPDPWDGPLERTTPRARRRRVGEIVEDAIRKHLRSITGLRDGDVVDWHDGRRTRRTKIAWIEYASREAVVSFNRGAERHRVPLDLLKFVRASTRKVRLPWEWPEANGRRTGSPDGVGPVS